MSMGGHQSARMGKDEWLTPPEIIRLLGPFDLDPCAPVTRPWDTAAKHYTVEDDGLTQPWEGRVWLNPPYGDQVERWMTRLANHGTGTALIFARTETEAFFRTVWQRADAVLFLYGRLYFHHVSGQRAAANAGAPSVLVAYGERDVERLAHARVGNRLAGAFVNLDATRRASHHESGGSVLPPSTRTE